MQAELNHLLLRNRDKGLTGCNQCEALVGANRIIMAMDNPTRGNLTGLSSGSDRLKT